MTFTRLDRLITAFSDLVTTRGPDGVARRNAAGALRSLALASQDRRAAEAALSGVGVGP